MTIVLLFFCYDIQFNGNSEVSQRHDQIRNIILELFTILSTSSLILFCIYCYGDRDPFGNGGMNFPSVSNVFICGVVYFVSVVTVTFFYFSLVKNANVAFTAVMIIVILYLFALMNVGFSIFHKPTKKP
jgi:hypothetical protein